MTSAETRWHPLTDAEAVARRTLRIVLDAADEAIARRGVFRLVLAGGTTPRRVYELLAGEAADWRNWQLFHGDERCLPVDDAERNSLLVEQAWLTHLGGDAPEHHPIPAERGAEQGALAYAATIGTEPFDLVLLGMGEDGHTASLFPGHEHPAGQAVLAVHDSPKPPPDRVSLSLAALANSRSLLIIVTGSGKRAAVAGWRGGADLPVARVSSRAGVDVLIDEAAFVSD